MNFNNPETHLLEYIQIPESAYKEAVNRYQSVGEYLTSDASLLKRTSPEIKPQGSFRLGTSIYPQSREKEFDLDLTMICGFLTPDNCTQKDFKETTMDVVQKYSDLHGMEKVEEKRRCVRLNYKSSNINNSSFHIDIVPAIYGTAYEKETIKSLKGIFEENSIFITDTKSLDFTKIHGRWLSSNPEGYALWFESRMRSEIEAQKRALLTSENANIDDIPIWRIKTGLQSTVQLLKWHRDCMFEKNPDVKPVSIIITTLAGMVYSDSISTVSEMLTKMIALLNQMNWTVKNPVDPREVFTDKWNEPAHKDDHLRENFEKWIQKAYSDFKMIEDNNLSSSKIGYIMQRSFNYSSYNNIIFHGPEIIIEKPLNKPYGY